VDGKRRRFDLTTRAVGIDAPAPTAGANGGRRGGFPARGRQFTEAWTADSARRAVYKDRNLFIANRDGSNERQLTTDGSESGRIKYGTASWVYGEELGQTTAMWWSPDGSKLAFYRFDEKPVKDYWLQTDQTAVQGSGRGEAYPKAGTENPIVDLFVLRPRTGATAHRRARRQAAHRRRRRALRLRHLLVEGRQRTAAAPHQPPAEHHGVRGLPPTTRRLPRDRARGVAAELDRELADDPWLADGKRFIWESERTGFSNYYLYDISGKLLATLTSSRGRGRGHRAVDEKAKQLWYYARTGDNFMKLQLHRVGLDGKGDKRLTDPALNHTVSVSPDGKYFVDVAQTRRSAHHAAHGRERQDALRDRRVRHHRHRRGGLQAGGDVHLHQRRRHDQAPRHDPQAVELRPVQEVSGACSRCTRARRPTARARRSARRWRRPSTASSS
jgi:dipeptidyl-peptidase-4